MLLLFCIVASIGAPWIQGHFASGVFTSGIWHQDVSHYPPPVWKNAPYQLQLAWWGLIIPSIQD